jgi:hypothetical protein
VLEEGEKVKEAALAACWENKKVVVDRKNKGNAKDPYIYHILFHL